MIPCKVLDLRQQDETERLFDLAQRVLRQSLVEERKDPAYRNFMKVGEVEFDSSDGVKHFLV